LGQGIAHFRILHYQQHILEKKSKIMQIIITGKVAIKPGKQAEALEATTRMAVASRAEAGCISYRFYSSLEEADTILAFEEWESDEALASHFQTEHMKIFQKALAELVAARPEIKRYEIQAVGPLKF
jgi:quinol monooxygenase YgiN